jgi:hypothetical protein
MGSSKSKAPKGPDYDKLLKLSDKYMQENSKFMKDYMKFFKSTYADQKKLSDKIANIQLPAMAAEAEVAQSQRDRYMEMGVPFENEYLDKITNWDSEERRDDRAGQAQAGVALAADAARESELRRLEGFGIDPSQTRSAALDSTLRLQTAMQKAAAGNQERNAVEREGLALGGEAVNLYRGLPSQSAQALATATGAGQTAMGNQQGLGAYGSGAYGQLGNMNTQGFNMANSAYNTANSIYGNQLASYEMNQKYSPSAGFGQLMGAGLGAAGSAGGFGNLFGFGAEGGPVKYAAEGGAIPANDQGQAKPAAMPRPMSEGIPADNVPTMLTKGEFVIPDDVARWEGEKNLQKLINKAREGRQTTEAQRAQNQRALGIPA